MNVLPDSPPDIPLGALPDALPPTVPHGGNLNEAVKRYGIARDRWIDLSTGINPHGYRVPAIDPRAWLRLPEDDDDLEAVAAHYFGATQTLAVAGTQAAIRLLPRCLRRGTVAIHALTYGEYAPAFERAGFTVERFTDASLPGLDGHRLDAGHPLPAHWTHLVIVNPNNPTAQLFDRPTLLGWRDALAQRGGTLIVDEAFGDAIPEFSVARDAHVPGLIVLRSIGKFFGLAGARVGFVIAERNTLEALGRLSGPWTIAGPARSVARAALTDAAWHAATRERLDRESARLQTLLEAQGLYAFRTPLFAWVATPNAEIIQDVLAKTGIWVRRFDRVPSLRFGLPGNEIAWNALSDGLLAALTASRR